MQLPRSGSYATANCILRPGEKLNRQQRRGLNRCQSAYIILDGDPANGALPGALPRDFDAISLGWAISRADAAVVWSGGIPTDTATFFGMIEPAIEDGCVLVALIRNAHLGEWLDLIAPEMQRRRAPLLTVGEHRDLDRLGIRVAA